MKKLLLSLILIWPVQAFSQNQGNNPTCPDQPNGSSNNRCANTRFVIQNAGVPTLPNNKIFVGNAGNIATAVTMSGDCTLVAAGAITCTKTNGTSFGYFATGTDASNLTGTVASARIAGIYSAFTGIGIQQTSPQTQLHATVVGGIVNGNGGQASGLGQVQLDSGVSALTSVGGIEMKIAGDGNGYGAKIQTLNSSGPQLVFANRVGSSTWAERFRIDSSGNGIFQNNLGMYGATSSTFQTPFQIGTNWPITTAGKYFPTATTSFTEVASITGNGSSGAQGALFAGRTSVINYSAIPVTSFAFADNASAKGGWPIYTEGHRFTASDYAYGLGEHAVVNRTNSVNPNNPYGNGGLVGTVVAQLDCGNGRPLSDYSSFQAQYGCSNAVLIAKNADAGQTTNTGFASGIVFQTGSIDPSNTPPRAIEFPTGYGLQWWADHTTPTWSISTTATTGPSSLVLGNASAVFTNSSLSVDGAVRFSGIPTVSTPGCLSNDASGVISGGASCSGGGLPNGGTVGQVLLKFSGSNGDANWYEPAEFNISTSPDVNCSTGALANPISTVATGKKNILIPPGCLITIAASDTLPTTMTVHIACGATVHVNTGQVFRINGPFVDVGPCGTLFTLAGTGSVIGIASARCEWWGCSTGASGATNSTAINNAIASVEGSTSTTPVSERKLTFSCGVFNIATMLTFDLSVLGNWTVQGCGGNAAGTTNRTALVAAASFTGSAAVWFTGAGAVPNITVSGLAILNDTAASGPTYGLLVGPTSSASLMNGYHDNLFTDINVSGFNTNIRQQNARLFKYNRVSTNTDDQHSTQVLNSIGWECYAYASSFCGDTEVVDSQITGQTTSRATYTGSISGTTLTVSGVSGVIIVGQGVAGQGGGVLPGTTISSGSGTTWVVNQSQTVTSRAMHATFTGTNVNLTDGGNAAGIVAGIRFKGFITYGGFTHINMSQSGAGGRIGDIWELPGNQHEGVDGNGTMVAASANGGSIEDVHFNEIYGSGNGFGFHFQGTVAGGASIKSWKISNSFLSNAAWQFVDFRGTGGHCIDMNVMNNTLRAAGADGAANPLIYYQDCENSNIIGNTAVAPATSRPHLFSLNTGGDYITCMSNNSGGVAQIFGSICDNAVGATHFKIGGTDSNQ